MDIRELKESEVNLIIPLMKSLYKKWDKIDPIDRIDGDWFSSTGCLDYLRNIISDKNKSFLVVFEDNKIIGYLFAEIETRKPFLQKTGYLAELYVLPDYRGSGLGSELFKKAMDWFNKKDIKRVTVGTHSFDDEAISFWESKGFVEFNKSFKLKTL